jgi:hypothetical protein
VIEPTVDRQKSRRLIGKRADGRSQQEPMVDPNIQYLTFTRPDIAYAVQQICLHMHDPREPHLTAMKRILRYL